jgi:hypothetical protein
MATTPTSVRYSELPPEVSPEQPSLPTNDSLDPLLVSQAQHPTSPARAATGTNLEKDRYLKPAANPEQNSKRRKTSVLLDGKDPDRNIILPLNDLLKFLSENFCCRGCRKILVQNEGDTYPIELEVFGVANSLHFNCSCGFAGSVRPSLVPEAKPKVEAVVPGQRYSIKTNAGDFQINRRLIMALQLFGSGRHGGSIVTGMLNLNVNPMLARWTDYQDTIGKAIIQIGKDVVKENLQIECDLSPVGKDGRKALDVAADTRWDKRGSGRKYDSLSGCSVAMGLKSQLPIGIEPMSTVCNKCRLKITHDADCCPKNYDGSAKGMEACGQARICTDIYSDEELWAYIATLITDDDASVRKILTHSFKALVEAGLMAEEDWPRYGSQEGRGKKKPDNGLLHILHAAITFLADKGHRVRGYASPIFAEANKSKKNGCGVTKADAERIKRRLSWTLRLHCGGTYEEFKTAVEAVLEHHFDNHEYCGDWCTSAHGTEEEVREQGFRFRSKTNDHAMYLFLKKHHDAFMQDEKLRQLFHQFDTNSVEGFNKFLTKFLHKDMTLCQTIENAARAYLALCLQSIGYRQTYKRLFELTGIELNESDMTSLFLRSEDAMKLWKKVHRRKESVKIKRMRTYYKKLREAVAQTIKDNKRAFSYSSGMMGPGGGEQEAEQQQVGGGNRKRKSGSCKHCGSTGHTRITSYQCPSNPRNRTAVATSDPVVQGK